MKVVRMIVFQTLVRVAASYCDTVLDNMVTPTPNETILSQCYLPSSSAASAITMMGINGVFSLIGCIGNTLVCLSVWKVKSLQTNPNFLLTNLALADGMVCMLAQPLLVALLYKQWHSECAHLLEKAYEFFGNFSASASILCLCALSTDRLRAVTRPWEYRPKGRSLNLLVGIPVSWGIPTVYVATRFAIGRVTSAYLSVILLTICYVLMVVCYIVIFVTIKYRRWQGVTNQARRSRREQKLAGTLALVIGVFTLMWTPLGYFRLGRPRESSGLGYSWACTIALCNSAINPGIYALRNKHFRRSFKQLLQGWLWNCSKNMEQSEAENM